MKFQHPAQTFENLDKPRISFSGFDLSHRHTTTFDMGQIIPIAVIECIPNDRFDLGASGVLRMQPLVAPVLHPIKLKVQAWFCPYRLLMSNSPGSSWADFITGGDQGTTVIALPTMNPTDMPLGACDVGSLWDRFGNAGVDLVRLMPSAVGMACAPAASVGSKVLMSILHWPNLYFPPR